MTYTKGKKTLPKSTSRVISVLKSFSAEKLDLSAADISRKTGIHKTTLHRLLLSLTNEGLLERNQITGKYNIGPELYAIGSLYFNKTDLISACEPVAKLLNDLSKETIFVAILKNTNILFVMKFEAQHVFQIGRYPGEIAPAHATALGKALLSDLGETEIDRMYPEDQLQQITKHTTNSRMKLKRQLENIRKTGIAIDREGSYERVEGIAALIRDRTGKGIASISIALPIFEVSELNTKRLGTLVKKGASLVSYRLGFRDVDNLVHELADISSWWEKNKPNSN